MVPVFLPPNVGESYVRQSVDPVLPAEAKTAGLRAMVLVKVCVSVTGEVTSVTFWKRENPPIDEAVKKAMFARRYEPFRKNGTLVPFCHPVNVSFASN